MVLLTIMSANLLETVEAQRFLKFQLLCALAISTYNVFRRLEIVPDQFISDQDKKIAQKRSSLALLKI